MSYVSNKNVEYYTHALTTFLICNKLFILYFLSNHEQWPISVASRTYFHKKYTTADALKFFFSQTGAETKNKQKNTPFHDITAPVLRLRPQFTTPLRVDKI